MTDSLATSAAIVTLGCGRNEVDSEQLAGLLGAAGLEVVDEAEGADVVLVNTCTFIAPAKQESVDTVLAACDLKDRGTSAVLIVGCMAQRYPDELAEQIPEADAVVGFGGYPMIGSLVGDILAGRPHDRVVGVEPSTPVTSGRALPLSLAPASAPAPAPAADDGPVWLADVREHAPGDRPEAFAQDDLDQLPSGFPVRRVDTSGGPRSCAYLKIASGCDRVCTFCAIPSFRGRFRSRPLDELVTEAAWLAQQGIRELVLVSENTTSWGKDLPGIDGRPGGRALQPLLLDELSQVDGIERLRLMYLQPAELQPRLLEAMAAQPKVANYFDLSLQHASARILDRMLRSGSPERFLALVERIRELAPDAVFRSNFILGFPGETDEDVATLEQFLHDARLDWVGLFTYSDEDGTAAVDLDGHVPEHEALDRLRALSDVQERLADAAAAAWVGREVDVLVDVVEDVEGDTLVLGRGAREAPDTDGEVRLVTADGSPATASVGDVVAARVVAADGVDLVAEVAD